MAYIATVPPVRFINIGSAVGSTATDPNHPDDVLIIRAFMIYLTNHRNDLQFTKARLKTLSGSVDADLTQMVNDYKVSRSKLSQLILPPEEQRNSRILPQNERFAIQAAARAESTMLALNLDVKSLAGYGDTAVDVMCNLFPIRGLLTGLPVRAESYWRDLARNKVPLHQWFRKQKEEAVTERGGAILRASRRTGNTPVSREDLAKMDEDNELFTLLQPYNSEMQSFVAAHTRVELATSPSPSADGQNVTLTATITSGSGQTPTGTVMILFAQKESVRIHGRQFLSQSRSRQYPLTNGKAIVPLDKLPKGDYLVLAQYPDTGAFLSSSAEMTHQVN